MTLFLIIDLGTSGTKITLYNDRLQVIRDTQFPTPFHVYKEVVSIDPEAILTSICSSIRDFHLDEIESEALFISVTGMGSTIMALSPGGEVIAPAVSWEYCFDGGTAAPVDLGVTGKVLLPTYPFYKIPWLREQARDREAVFLSLPDYILSAFRDFQQFVTDYSFASRSLLFSDLEYAWDEAILEFLHLSLRNLPAPAAAGEAWGPVTAGKMRALHLPASSTLCPGMHDHMATACLGTRLCESAALTGWVNSMGTTESLLFMADRNRKLVREAPARLLNTEAAWNSQSLALLGYSCPSGKIMKAAAQFDIDWRGLEDSGAALVSLSPPRKRNLPGDEGWLHSPGEVRLPWKSVWRQMVLATQFELRRVMDDMKQLLHKGPRALLCFGGQSENERLCALKSSVMKVPVYAFPGLNAAALGTALCVALKNGVQSAEGFGLLSGEIWETAAVYEPDPGAATRFDELYNDYKGKVEYERA